MQKLPFQRRITVSLLAIVVLFALFMSLRSFLYEPGAPVTAAGVPTASAAGARPTTAAAAPPPGGPVAGPVRVTPPPSRITRAPTRARPTPTRAAANATPQPGDYIASIDWYRYQGAPDAGACARANCIPAVAAMAIQYAGQEDVPITEIRSFMSGANCRGGDLSDVQRALKEWNVGYRVVNGMPAIKAAVTERAHPVVVVFDTSLIEPGEDYQTSMSDVELRTGRYYDYAAGHAATVTGFTPDGKYVVVQDPYVFDDEGSYWYADNTPKGLDRLYDYDEFAASVRVYGYVGLEIMPD